MIKEFLNSIFAPNKLMQAITGLREENARLRHELRHYTEFTYQQKIEPHFKSKPGYMEHLYRGAWRHIAGALSNKPEIYERLVTPLSAPERASSFIPGDDRFPSEKLTIRVLVRMPTPMLQGVPVPCEEDPDWVLEEYALKMREQDPPHLKRPFMRISLSKRIDLMSLAPSSDFQAQELISRVAVVRFERDGTPYVVTR
jgi:hypothetical protein